MTGQDLSHLSTLCKFFRRILPNASCFSPEIVSIETGLLQDLLVDAPEEFAVSDLWIPDLEYRSDCHASTYFGLSQSIKYYPQLSAQT